MSDLEGEEGTAVPLPTADSGSVAAGAPGDPEGPGAPPTPDRRRPRARRTRTVIAWVLVVIASLLIPISVISVWAIRTVTNTDQYVATMAPLARNQAIIDHLAQKATDELFSTGIVQKKVTAALPKAAKPIVQPVVTQVKSYVNQLALKVFESPKFAQLWDGLNRRTHQAVVDILTGKQSPLQEKVTKAGAVVVNLSPALGNIIDEADKRGVTLFNPLKPIVTKGSHLGLTIVSKDQVKQYSAAFNLIVKLKWIIPIIALALALIGIVVGVDHRKVVLRMAVGVSLVTLLLLAALSLARSHFLSVANAHNYNTAVGAAVWDTLLRFLKADFRWMLLVAILVAIAMWLIGPARYAVWVRVHIATAARWVWAQVRGLSSGAGRAVTGSQRVRHVGAWIDEHIAGLRIIGAVVAGCFIVFGGNLTGWSLVVILIVLAVYLALLQLVAIWARRIEGSAVPPGDTPGRAQAL
jgi:hypothetical protein